MKWKHFIIQGFVNSNITTTPNTFEPKTIDELKEILARIHAGDTHGDIKIQISDNDVVIWLLSEQINTLMERVDALEAVKP